MLSVGSKSNESHTRIQTIYVPVFHCYFSKNDTFDDTITEVVTTSPLTEQKSSSNFNQTILRRHSAMYEYKRKQHSYMNVVLTVLSTIKQTEYIVGVLHPSIVFIFILVGSKWLLVTCTLQAWRRIRRSFFYFNSNFINSFDRNFVM